MNDPHATTVPHQPREDVQGPAGAPADLPPGSANDASVNGPQNGAQRLDSRAEITWHVETEQPDGTWEQSSSSRGRPEDARALAEALRRRHPDTRHRLIRRTVTTHTAQEEVQ